MNNDINNTNPPVRNNGKAVAGIVLLVVGACLLFKQFDIFSPPHWLISFPMAMIVVGLYIGARTNFKNIAWIIVTIVGFASLLDDIFPHVNVSDFFWPAAMIGFGVYLILRKRNSNDWDKKDWKAKWERSKYNFGTHNPTEPVVDYTVKPETDDAQTPPPNTGSATGSSSNTFTGDEHLDAVSVFGSVKKTIFSKNFQGGEIVNVMGGTELDFTQANINGRVYVDITQIFGGTKIIVPSHWMVVSDMAAVFAGVDDKRIKTNAPPDSSKVLVLKGVSIFAGVDIRSY
ncbi:DUF5668 domain-containing protein [Mucilaginibacter sp. dw_454]|uniref:LiaF transmembrane domain-containing protein n=1 Tax=Mucilaginibacter sp. dw_454 TaxID=2720079 RepID=UPI001BD30C00|nr:DUF5668 domain-containing protein [Mucilaginibacter sp. dw_454]